MEETVAEVLITCNRDCCIYDVDNGNQIASYTDKEVFAPKTLSLIGNDYLIGAYLNRPILKVWTISKQRKREAGSFLVPGQVSALAVSECGRFCIAGIKNEIYVWEVSTGEVLAILGRHYQAVTCLKFTSDSSRFFSGGKDGHVCVWILSSVVDVRPREGTLKPQNVFSKHAAEVTDIYCGFSVSRVATTALDMTCNIYELDSGILLSSIQMDVPLTCVVMDPLEYFIFLGDVRGYIYRIITYERLPLEMDQTDPNFMPAMKIHHTKIISLAVTMDGKRLMTASEDRFCKLWDIQSMACLLNIQSQEEFSNAFLALRPPSLSKEVVLPELRVRKFEKSIGLSNPDERFIEATIHPKKLSLIYDGCPDKHYKNSIFCQRGAKAKEIDAAACEESFQEAIHGENLSTMTKLNQNLFTISLFRNLNSLYPDPPSPS